MFSAKQFYREQDSLHEYVIEKSSADIGLAVMGGSGSRIGMAGKGESRHEGVGGEAAIAAAC